jgi:hypothetical protein
MTEELTRDAALAKAMKGIKGVGPNAKTMTLHNRNTVRSALECASVGLPVVVVHSIDDTGECTCQYKREQRIAEGHTVAPCSGSNRGKHPKGNNWPKTQTTDYGQIAARWSGPRGYLNMGIVFGASSGVILVEADGAEGVATATAWQESGLLPRTVTVESGSGGLHFYLRVPNGWDIRNSVKVIGRGIDVRGENGFSVGPGSRHWSGIDSGWKNGNGVYGFVEGCGPDDGMTIADAPVPLLRMLWFATKERRHMTAPDGSVWSDAGLPEPVETAPDNTGANPFAASSLGGSFDAGTGAGWEARVALIGHGDGLRGFDGGIYEAACSYFGSFGHEAEADTLKTALLARIREAPENDPGHRDRYLTDEYMDARIAQGRTFIASKGGEAVKPKTPADPWPDGFCAVGPYVCWLRYGDGKPKVTAVKMCGLFEVVGHTLDETAEAGAGLLIAYRDKHGRQHEHIILDSDTRSDTGAVIAKLSDAVFWIDNTTEQKSKFLTLLGRLGDMPQRLVTIASRAGWHDRTFVTPYGKAHGAHPTMRLAQSRRFEGAKDRRGTLAGWQGQAMSLVMSMDFHGPVLLCASFAGALIDLLGDDTCGISITGESSRGKTISQRFASTVWGNPAVNRGVFVNVRGTANGLELAAARSSGTCLHLDELKGANAAQIGEIIMMLAGGVSKIRMNADQGQQATSRWHTYFTLSAEESIRALIEGGHGSYVTGFGVRAVEIDTTDATKFECPEFVEGFKASIGDHWGIAGPAFIDWLIAGGYTTEAGKARLLERLAEETKWLLDGDAGGGVKGRAAGVLSYALVAGGLAQKAGILPIEEPILIAEAIQEAGEAPDDMIGAPRDAGWLRHSFRKAWLASWGAAEGTPENGPDTAFARLQGIVAAEWHLHAFDAIAVERAKGDEHSRPGDGEPKQAKWFHHGDKCLILNADSTCTDYVAITEEAFRHLTRNLGCKPEAIIRWAKKAGKLIPRDERHFKHEKLPGYGAVANYRFHVGEFGPGGNDQDDDPLDHPPARPDGTAPQVRAPRTKIRRRISARQAP